MPVNYAPGMPMGPMVSSPIVGPQVAPMQGQAGGGAGGAASSGMDGLVRAMMLAKMRQGQNPGTPSGNMAFGPPAGAGQGGFSGMGAPPI